jgi:hypothetical protein
MTGAQQTHEAEMGLLTRVAVLPLVGALNFSVISLGYAHLHAAVG